MIFLCDVHIAIKVVKSIENKGFKCLHVNSILDSWHTKDSDICKYVDTNDLILITKDVDFKNSHFIQKTPKKLVKINLGNISNMELMDILEKTLLQIQEINNQNDAFIIEIGKEYTRITPL
jgi:predicted nuclease of predicted toxin-antitoxin system